MKKLILLTCFLSVTGAFAANDYECFATLKPVGKKEIKYDKFEVGVIAKGAFLKGPRNEDALIEVTVREKKLTIVIYDIGVPKDKGGNEAGNKLLGQAAADWDAKHLVLDLATEGFKVECNAK